MGVETLMAIGMGAKTAATVSSIGSILGTGLSVVSGVSSIFGGMQSNQEAANQAALAKTQAMQQSAESARLARREAGVVQEEAEKTRKAQKLAFLKSGVSLEGSPLLLMEETRMKGAENVSEVLKAGAAGSYAAMQEGRIKAKQYKASGREALVSGLTGAGAAFSRILK